MNYMDKCPTKGLNVYVQNMPLTLNEHMDVDDVYAMLPLGSDYVTRVRVAAIFYPSAAFTETMVGYETINDQGQRVETLAPLSTFDVNSVPWDDVIV